MFTGDEIIGDILSQLPEAGDILSSHGIGCASCHVNAYETLSQGILGHGYGQDLYERILLDLNEAASDCLPAINKPDPVLTDAAVEKVQEFQALKNAEGFGFKVEVIEPDSDEPGYFLDFIQRPYKDDKTVESKGVKMFLDLESWRYLKGKTIDFVEDGESSGFKVENSLPVLN